MRSKLGGRITGFTFFLDTDRIFPLFGLSARLDDGDDAAVTATPGAG